MKGIIPTPDLEPSQSAGAATVQGGGLDEYERLMAPARERFLASSGVLAIQASHDEAFLESFLMHFCALGSQMTESVERWIRGAAERCSAIGLSELARALTGHARAEAGHHLMMIADVRALAARRDARWQPPVDVNALLNQPPSPGVIRYCNVHEANIAGDTPYAQIAIEFEVEMLPALYGELFIARCVEILGADVLPCLSFVTEHIVLDVGHTQFNARAIDKLLAVRPSCLPALVAAGTAVLGAYAQFLTDCAQLAQRDPFGTRGAPAARSVPLTWRLRSPPEVSCGCGGRLLPDWLEDVRLLRGLVLFDNGRRPHFRTTDGRFFDADSIDLYSYHILAYDGSALVGCVRVYPLAANGPACVSEEVLGEETFSELLDNLGIQRRDTVEIGRWIVHPAYRASGRPGTLLAAASAAFATTLGNGSAVARGMVICAVGTGRRGQRSDRSCCRTVYQESLDGPPGGRASRTGQRSR